MRAVGAPPMTVWQLPSIWSCVHLFSKSWIEAALYIPRSCPPTFSLISSPSYESWYSPLPDGFCINKWLTVVYVSIYRCMCVNIVFIHVIYVCWYCFYSCSFIVSTDDGRVIKAINKGRTSKIETEILRTFQVFDNGAPVTSLRVYRNSDIGQEKLIVMSRDEIKTIPLYDCNPLYLQVRTMWNRI